MEVKIKSKEGLLAATIEMIDGVMVVSPKEKNDVTKFKTGDIITCGRKEDDKSCSWVSILDGRITDEYDGRYFMKDFCYFYLDERDDALIAENSSSDAATYVRYATEEEKEKLFKALAEKGFEWDVEKKELVKLKWKPKVGEICFAPYFDFPKFITKLWLWEINGFSTDCYNKNWIFRTEQECQEFCDRLNKAIESIKP